MSSRQEEKARRRQEREALEERERAAEARRRRFGIVGGGVLAAAVVGIVALAIAASSGDDDGSGGSVASDLPTVPIPARSERDLAAAAEAAGCEVAEHPEEDGEHTTEPVRYATDPPTSGSHDPVPAQDGVYDPGNPPDLEQSVHSLEHGRIALQYRSGTPARRVGQLQTLFDEEIKGNAGYHTLLFENQSGMTAAVAATAWTRSLTCPQFNDRVWDALRAFRQDFVDKGPEFVP
jgi:hypothetical protein